MLTIERRSKEVEATSVSENDDFVAGRSEFDKSNGRFPRNEFLIGFDPKRDIAVVNFQTIAGDTSGLAGHFLIELDAKDFRK